MSLDRGQRFNRPAGQRQAPQAALNYAPPSRVTLLLRRLCVQLSKPPLRHLGVTLFVVFFVGTGAYGAVRGGHAEAFASAMHDAGDAAARAFGFGIVQVDISGARVISREELLERAGITANSSLLLLNADHVRASLKQDPRIAEATVRKFYPDRIEFAIEERPPFARWQRAGKMNVIAQDGTVLEPDVGARYADLPLVVGVGAGAKASAFLDLMNSFPSIRDVMRAGILVAERRWNLRMKNGIDVRLPEEDPALALQQLVNLDKSKQLLSRDVTVIDLRVPDRVSVGLSDEITASIKKTPKKKGADS
jgi:cell division protein FtsQ